jgi:hypothetical protein
MKKRSDVIRESIGTLIYEQTICSSDEMQDNLQTKIDKLRSKLKLVEEDEKLENDKEEED